MMMFHYETKRLAQALLLPINPAVAVLLGFYTTVWGLWVANPFWGVFGQAPLYEVLASITLWIIPAEILWGSIAILCGMISMYGAIRPSYRSLVLGASVMGWHWFMISVFYFLGDALNTGGITALTFAIYGAFIYLNVKVNFNKQREYSDLHDRHNE